MSTAIKSVWSKIDVSQTGAFKEASQAQLLSQIWADETLKQEMLTTPKVVFEREVGITFPANVEIKVLEESPTHFYFIAPYKPGTETEIAVRLEQMSGWWMAAHTCWWWVSWLGDSHAEAFREALHAMIIGHVWTDESFRQAMLTHPKTALMEETGIIFPKELTIQTLEETAQLKYLVLPGKPQVHRDNDRLKHPSEWWMTTHTFWLWLVWLQLHTPTSSL